MPVSGGGIPVSATGIPGFRREWPPALSFFIEYIYICLKRIAERPYAVLRTPILSFFTEYTYICLKRIAERPYAVLRTPILSFFTEYTYICTLYTDRLAAEVRRAGVSESLCRPSAERRKERERAGREESAGEKMRRADRKQAVRAGAGADRRGADALRKERGNETQTT